MLGGWPFLPVWLRAYYRVRVEADGYAPTRTADLDLSPGQKIAIIVKLARNASALKTIASVVAHTSDVFVVDVTSESAQRIGVAKFGRCAR